MKPKNESPTITIITPSLNQSAFLEKSIQSVLDQEYPNFEFIIIDGGSTDGSIDIIKKYEDKITYWISEPDQGQSHAINKGLRIAKGDFIGWINADDFFLPGAFEALSEAINRSENLENIGFFFGTGIRVNRNGEKIADFWPHPPVFDIFALLYGFDYILQPTVFIKKDALDQVGEIDESLKYCMDYDLWIRLGETYEIIPINHPVAASREYKETKSMEGGLERCAEISRMVQKYTDFEVTPGVLYYLIRTIQLLTETTGPNQLFSKDFKRTLEILHTENMRPLLIFSEKSPGFPQRKVTGNVLKQMSESLGKNSGVLSNLENQLLQLHQTIRKRDNEIDELIKLLKESEDDRKARLSNIEELTKLLDKSELDRKARFHQIIELTNMANNCEEKYKEALNRLDEVENKLYEVENKLSALGKKNIVRISRKLNLIKDNEL